jgi:thiol-disulfide isomerase/thioredoxin
MIALISARRFAACVALLVASVSAGAAPAAKRPAKEVMAELSQVTRQLQRYDFAAQVDEKYRHQMPGELTAQYQQHLKLLDELATVAPTERAAIRPAKARDLAVLALFKDEEAAKQIDTLKASKVPTDATLGQYAALMLAWWADPKAEAQAKVLADAKALAKTNATDDALCAVLLEMSNASAATEALAESLRVCVETDLKSAAALKYKARPDKLGRPLVVAGNTVQGKPFTSQSLKGKVIIVDFWATWCPPCREALPGLIEFYKLNKEKGLEVVGVSCDSRKQDLQQFLKDNPDMSWPNLFGPTGGNGWHALATKYEVRSVPTMYIIDRDGILRQIAVGRFPKADIQKLIDAPQKPAADSQ